MRDIILWSITAADSALLLNGWITVVEAAETTNWAGAATIGFIPAATLITALAAVTVLIRKRLN